MEHIPEPGPGIREWVLSAVLLSLTIASASFAGLCALVNSDPVAGFHVLVAKPSLILLGLPFSIPWVTILLAHELGHFFACRYYGMRCTPPYFLPVPISLGGTLGAFIKIKSQFRNKRALFDIGIAGPLAGFIFVLPTLIIGIHRSHLIPKSGIFPDHLSFGEPLIFRLLGKAILGYDPSRQDMMAHPFAMAAWFGLLATCLNLFPIWQLDGGHIAYAILGRTSQKRLSIVCIAALILISFLGWPPSITLLVFSSLVLIIGLRTRFFHPPVLSEEEKLGPGRLLLGFIAFLILILSFIRVPVTIT